MEDVTNVVQGEGEDTSPLKRRRGGVPEGNSGGRLLIGYVLVLVGVVMLIAGWYGVSGQPIISGQLSYLVSGGLGGLLAGIVGVGLLVSHDVRKDRERLGRVEAAMLEIRELLLTQAQTQQRLEDVSAGDAVTTSGRSEKAAG